MKTNAIVVDRITTNSKLFAHTRWDAIPVAAGILMPWGIDLPMAIGAIAMSASTIIVAANAQLLRRVRLRREAPTTGLALHATT